MASKRTISQQIQDGNKKVALITQEIEDLKNQKEEILANLIRLKQELDENFDGLFQFAKSRITGDDNFKTGKDIANIFPKQIQNTYGVAQIMKRLTAAAKNAGYHRHIKYINRVRHYAFFTNKQFKKWTTKN